MTPAKFQGGNRKKCGMRNAECGMRHGVFHCAANCTTLGAERELTAINGSGGGAKHPLTCSAQLNCVSSRHGKQADSDALRRSAGSQPMGLPIGYGFTHDFALCRSAGAVRQFHRLRHAFSVQMVWYLSLTYGQAHRLSSGTPSARFSHKHLFSSKHGCKAPFSLCSFRRR